MNRLLAPIISLCTVTILAVAGFCFADVTQEGGKMTDQTKNSMVLIKTSAGDMKVELFDQKAPITVKNFLTYAKEGFYENTIFHRVIVDFMVQGGGFTPEMEQKPVHAAIKNEADNGLKNTRGTLAMARTGVVDSATAQFFINVVDNSFLDFRNHTTSGYGYCVFGQVIEGMDVIDKIRKCKTCTKGHHENVPVETIEILEVKILPTK